MIKADECNVLNSNYSHKNGLGCFGLAIHNFDNIFLSVLRFWERSPNEHYVKLGMTTCWKPIAYFMHGGWLGLSLGVVPTA